MNDTWEPVPNVDFSRRTPGEWAEIYQIELLDTDLGDRLWSEYEWAYNLTGIRYRPKTSDFETFSRMELRAMELRRDVFLGASPGERELLNERYVETEWVRKRLNVLY